MNPEETPQGILDAAAVSSMVVPGVGDVAGLLADVNRYRTDPASRTPGNFALTGIGMLPLIPSLTVWHGSPHRFAPGTVSAHKKLEDAEKAYADFWKPFENQKSWDIGAFAEGISPYSAQFAATRDRLRRNVDAAKRELLKSEKAKPLGEFDPSKIGTGERAQARGYGHYVAESKRVPMSPKTNYMQNEQILKRVSGGLTPLQERISDAMDAGKTAEQAFSELTGIGYKVPSGKFPTPFDAFRAEWDVVKGFDSGSFTQRGLCS